MTYVQQAIQKAIKGGYDEHGKRASASGYRHYQSDVFLDPLFWSSLGKALGWYVHEEHEYPLPIDTKERREKLIYLEDNVGVILRIIEGRDCAIVSPYKKADSLTWKEHWHRFIDHLISGKDAESYFKELLK